VSFIDELSNQLAAVGIRGALHRRILVELEDHLSCDPDAELGSPYEVAREFADELGTGLARRAAFATFVALAVAGVALAIVFVTWQGGVFRSASSAPARLDAAIMAVASQLALVGGALAAVRALRRHRAYVVSRSEATVIVRRAGVGLTSGIAAMAALALLAAEQSRWWAVTAAAVGMVALVAAAPAVVAASRVRPTLAGPRGDVFDDLGALAPPRMRGRPWRFALAVAGLVAVAIALAGALQADGFDGILRGLLDALACLAGFAVLGRYLGLRA
jgi:hypothetical protein